jgi:molybdopterin synthase catalytic subunit
VSSDKHRIEIRAEPIVEGELYQLLSQLSPAAGALVTFSGKVRDFDNGSTIDSLFLEHYPGMTEQSLASIAEQAHARFSTQAIVIAHRIGEIGQRETIVYVGVSSAHRRAAFNACEFIMDYLKNDAPFWKKERGDHGEQWVQAKDSDITAKSRWQEPQEHDTET